jgi:hypothetical protein
LEQLVGAVVKTGLRQLGRDNAPDQPDRKTEVLGNDRPDEIASRDGFAPGFPEDLVLGIPVGNPSRVSAGNSACSWARFLSGRT